MNTTPFSICVYCGSRTGVDASHAQAAREVGRAIGQQGWQLVYGGGKVGLMGVVADAVLAHGGRVVGVIPRMLMDREVGHTDLQELHVVDSMHQRKQMMAERAQAFLALPGGIGTMEELFEVWTWRQIGYHARPIGVLNVDGYYDALLRFLQHTVDQGFLGAAQRQVLQVGEDPTELIERLHTQAGAISSSADYRGI